MALVSSCVPIHLRQSQMERRLPMRGFSRMSSIPSASSRLGEIEEVEKVYVAVGKEYKEGKETLIWALQHASRNKKIVLVHVHQPAKKFCLMGALCHESQLSEEQVRAFRQQEKQKTDKILDEYLVLCSHAKVQAEKVVIEMDDIGKGLVDLIALHGITKLVMGAAAGSQYSKRMKAPKSKTAIRVQQQANPSCRIWFICKGNLIYPRIARSPAASISARSMQSEPMRSTFLTEHHREMLNWSVHRSRSDNFDLRNGGSLGTLPLQTSINTSEISNTSCTDPFEVSSEGFQALDHSTQFVTGEVLSNIGSLPLSRDEDSEKALMMLPSAHESDEDLQSSNPSPSLEMENVIDSEVHEKLLQALKEVEDYKHETYLVSCKRRKAERAAIDATRKAKTSEILCTKELKQRKDTEMTLKTEKNELKKLRSQRDEVVEEVQKATKQKLKMELKVAEAKRMIKGFEEKLAEMRSHLSSLAEEHKEMQRERDDAIREAKELRRRRDEATSSIQGFMNFSEFTYSELERATNNFDDSLKIGEGGYGSVFKGFLRHTMVAIKMLKAESSQGLEEFYQEVDMLSQVRHPHLVILMGKCTEVCALIYEYLPQGSLEDRLLCKDNTPPLSWQVRTRIITEICSGVIFLHSNKPRCIVHGDIKPSNVLLDLNLVSKIGDFGICRQIVQTNTNTAISLHHLTNPKGTYVKMDPEFVNSAELTPHSDIYSFGVIILYMLTGRQAFGVIEEVKEAMERGILHEVLDVSAGDWPFVQAKQLAHLALRCCESESKNRPDITGEIWRVLEPMKMAAFPAASTSLSLRSAPGDSCVPSYFICPIFQEIMRYPHITADGYTYEAEAFRGWLDCGHNTSPMTNVKLSHNHLTPNHALRSAIQEWLQQHPSIGFMCL